MPRKLCLRKEICVDTFRSARFEPFFIALYYPLYTSLNFCYPLFCLRPLTALSVGNGVAVH